MACATEESLANVVEFLKDGTAGERGLDQTVQLSSGPAEEPPLSGDDLTILSEFLNVGVVGNTTSVQSTAATAAAIQCGSMGGVVWGRRRRWTLYHCPEPGCKLTFRKLDAFERHKDDHISGVKRKRRSVVRGMYDYCWFIYFLV